MGQFSDFLGRARDWWSRDDADDFALGGPALDPAYNGWYVTAVPRHETAESTDDRKEATGRTENR